MIRLLRRLYARLLPPPAPPQGADDEPEYRPLDHRLVLRLLGWLRPYWRGYLLGLLAGMVAVALEMQGPLFIRGLIDYCTGFAAGLGGGPASAAGLASASWHVAGWVGLWAALLAVSLLLHRAEILCVADAGERVQFDLRRALFAHLQRLSMSYYDRTRLGRIMSRCTSDIQSLREVNVWGISIIAKNTLMLLLAGTMLALTDWRLFLAVAWLGPLLYAANAVYRRHAATQWQIAREGYTRVATNLAENISGVRVVSAFHRQVWNLKTFNTLQDANTTNNVQVARLSGVYQPVLHLIGLTGRLIILSYGATLAARGELSHGVGSVVAAFLYWDWFMGPIVAFGNFHNQLLMAMAGAERVFQLLDTPPEVQDAPDAYALERIRGRVEFESVTFGYQPDRPVLHDVSFAAAPGETIALVGATGSGKSTIMALLARLYQPQQGCIRVDGHDLRRVTGASLHSQIGLVLQNNFLFAGTVLENMRYARPAASDADVERAVRELGCEDVLRTLPDGLQTRVGERGANVSLGQRQLICFVRAFVADARIFLFDEATSAVDTATEFVLQRSLERLLRGRTAFVVAHRLSTIQRADCILVLDHGRIVERGTHAELLRGGGRYSRLHAEFVRAGSA